MAPQPIRILDLFAGAGGLTAGLTKADPRFASVAAVEMDPFAAASYALNHPDAEVFALPIEQWLEDHEITRGVDVIVGGPPCQGFSTLGKQDEQDERNLLWRQYAETIVRYRPKYFVVENVAAFAKSPQFEQFRRETEPGGTLSEYNFEHTVLNAADFGAPQARRRAVVIGHLRNLPFPGFPTPTHDAKGSFGLRPHRTVREALATVPDRPDRDHLLDERRTAVGGRRAPGPFLPRDMHWSRDYADMSLQRFAAIPPGGNRFDLPDELLAPCWRKHQSGSADVMGRMHWDKPSVTVRTEFFKPEKGRYLHPEANRAITHFEAAILQGFPANHQFVGSRVAIARQIGNAVPIPLGEAIGRMIAAQFPVMADA
ncbi:DNA cytosine methyltransferase [Demequina subtropica]|uniref:DNA cytosine methyltransferase n=1 Tax=Demequina subtropica TaxID=1638989 RepID=UPI000780E535|nr:DNA cytosine methyltransferase [Demequina subtropica]